MLYSMTGFGRAERETSTQRISVEIRSVNSKGLDLRIKLSPTYQSREIDARKYVSPLLIRGKVDVTVIVEHTHQNEHTINRAAFDHYYQNLQEIATYHGIEQGDIFYTVTRLPGVVVQQEDGVADSDWEAVKTVMDQAIVALQRYRREEGVATYEDILSHIQQIEQLLDQIDPHETGRIEKIRARLESSLEQLQAQGKVDEHRLEQELLYYLDKFDLNEEKVRLRQHCQYFVEELHQDVDAKGKKLTFILQEMGREINTLGSKANSTAIQHLVIQMKNEADKIKEQLANVL